MLTADEIRRAGRDARFRLRRDGCNTKYQGAHFVDGVTVNPVQKRHALRLCAAFGAGVVAEPYDEPTEVKVEEPVAVIKETIEETETVVEESTEEEPPKRKRGRPRKIRLDDDT